MTIAHDLPSDRRLARDITMFLLVLLLPLLLLLLLLSLPLLPALFSAPLRVLLFLALVPLFDLSLKVRCSRYQEFSFAQTLPSLGA